MKTINMSTRLSRKYVEANKPSRLYLMVELATGEKTPQQERLPLNLGFVIDRSGSMGGEKLAYTKQAVNYAVNHLAGSDYASLTVYDDEADVLVEGQAVVDKDRFRAGISRIFCGGCTNLSGGLIRGYREVMKNHGPERMNRVLLLTDGLANQGITDKTKLCRKVSEMKNTGVAVTTLGVGEDFDEDLLTAMAEASGGSYFFIDSTEKIPAIFAQEMQALLSVVAQNVKLVFCESEYADVTRVWGYRPAGDKEISINLPDIFSSDRRVILMEITLSGFEIGSLPIGALSLSYDDVEADLAYKSYTIDLAVECTDDKLLLDQPADCEVMLNVELNRTADIKEEAILMADAGDIDGATDIMGKQLDVLTCYEAGVLPDECTRELKQEVANINASLLSLRHEKYNAMTRKRMAYESYLRRKSQKLRGN